MSRVISLTDWKDIGFASVNATKWARFNSLKSPFSFWQLSRFVHRFLSLTAGMSYRVLPSFVVGSTVRRFLERKVNGRAEHFPLLHRVITEFFLPGFPSFHTHTEFVFRSFDWWTKRCRKKKNGGKRLGVVSNRRRWLVAARWRHPLCVCVGNWVKRRGCAGRAIQLDFTSGQRFDRFLFRFFGRHFVPRLFICFFSSPPVRRLCAAADDHCCRCLFLFLFLFLYLFLFYLIFFRPRHGSLRDSPWRDVLRPASWTQPISSDSSTQPRFSRLDCVPGFYLVFWGGRCGW